jgi:site-specific DNA-cytosine methylase
VRYASVCDGIGAAHVAWQPLGWKCSWTSEIEPFPAAVVEHHFGFANIGDMTQITEEMLDAHGPVDLLVGGTPCQSFSVAGLRGGLADPRGNLALRFVQLAAVMQPKWIVWENVPGVLSSGKGRDFGTFLGALGELGYGFAYRVLDAQWFGVAQRRRRVFVVGHLGDWRRAAAVLFERESVFGNPPTRGKAWEGVARSTAASLTSSGRGVERCGESRGQDDVVLGRPIWRGGDQANSEHCIDHAGTLNCDKWQQGGIVGIPDPACAIAAGNQGKGGVFGSGRGSQDTFAVVAFHPTQDPISSVDGSTHAMGCGSKGGCCTQAVAFQSNLGSHGGDVFEDGTSPTVRVGSGLGIPSPPAVAFKPSHFTRGKDGAPADVVAPLSADADKGDQDTVLAVPFTKSKRDQSTTDDETWVPGEVSPTMSCFDQGDTRATTVVAFTTEQTPKFKHDCALTMTKQSPSGGGQPQCVAFTQNCRDEVRQINGDGQIAGALSADSGSHQTNYVAYDITGTLATNGGKETDCHTALRSRPPGQSEASTTTVVAQGFTYSGYSNQPAWMTGDRTDCLPASGHSDGSHQGVGVATAMAVRRLTPRECERLQGFPDNYTLVEYRKKPAADGPRYRALGNSMAVPVMRWIGERIAMVEGMQ